MGNLLQQNTWLRDPTSREKALRIAAASSSAIEGIRKPYAACVAPPVHGSPLSAKSRMGYDGGGAEGSLGRQGR